MAKTLTLIQRWLDKHGITQSALARSCGVTVSYMNNLINRRYKNIHIDLLRSLSRETKIPMDKLVDDLLYDYDSPRDGAA